jgi:hypothetical protein
LNFRIVRRAQASWPGALPDGSGRISPGSGALDDAFSLRAMLTTARLLAGTEITPEANLAAS